MYVKHTICELAKRPCKIWKYYIINTCSCLSRKKLVLFLFTAIVKVNLFSYINLLRNTKCFFST